MALLEAGGHVPGLNDNRVVHKPLSMCGQSDFARLPSRLDNHLGQSIEYTTFPFHWSGFARKTQAHTFVDTARAIAVMDHPAMELSPA